MGRKRIFPILGALFYSRTLMSLPELPQVIHGEALFVKDTSSLTVETSDRSIIQWESFSIASGEKTVFQLPTVDSTVLNRVLGGNPTEIYGNLSSNGQVYLINPQGIFVGKDGLIDTAAFLASTLNCCDCDFLKQDDLWLVDSDSQGVVNEGTIVAKLGDVALLGGEVINRGVIEAPQGTIAIGAGAALTFCPQGDEKIQIVLQSPNADRGDDTRGIDIQGVLRSAFAELKSDGNLYAYAIKSDGVIEATGIEEVGGRVYLVAEKGFIAHTGDIRGDAVRILGEHIRILEDASIDVSGETGGGTILIGGDYQGANPAILNAESTFVDEGVSLRADALGEGDGGKIITWADRATGFLGKASVKGGPQGGDGGFVEVSGKESLDFLGFVDATAPLGKVGQLLLDPTTLNISTGADVTATLLGCPGTGSYTFGASPSNINIANLQTNLATCDITINATITGTGGTGAITLSNALTMPAGTHSLTIIGTSITLNAALANNSTSGLLSVSSTTTTITSVLAGTINNTSTGGMTFSAATTATFGGAITSSNGNVSFTAGTNLSFNANFTNNSATGTTSATAGTTVLGALTIGAGTTFAHSSTGTISLISNAVANSTMSINGILNVSNANLTMTTNRTFTLAASPAAITFNSVGKTFNYSTTNAAGSSTTLTGPVTITDGSATWSAAGNGTMALNGGVTTAGSGTFSISMGTGALSTAGNFSHGASGDCTWTSTGGSITTGSTFGSTATGGNISVTAGTTLAINAAVTNNSVGKNLSFTTSPGTTIITGAGGTITTAASSGNLSFDANTSLTFGATVTHNSTAGNFTSTAKTNTTFNANFSNNSTTGTTSVTAGTANLGVITIAAATTFSHISSGDVSLTSNATVGSDIALNGALNVTGANLNVLINDDFPMAATGSINFNSPGKTFTFHTTDPGTGSVATFGGPVVANGNLLWTLDGGVININNTLTTSGTGIFSISASMSTGGNGITSNASGIITHGSSGDLTFVTLLGDITLSGGLTVSSSNATFTTQDDFTLAATGTIGFSAAGKTLLFNHPVVGATTSHTFTGAVNVTAGNMEVDTFDTITISANTGSVTYDVPGGSLIFNATGGASPDFVLNGILTVSHGVLSIITLDDITFGAASTLNYSSPDPITLSADVGAGSAITWNGTANVSNGTLMMDSTTTITFGGASVTTYTSPLPWTMVAGGALTVNGTIGLNTAANWNISSNGMAINNTATNTSTGNFLIACGGSATVGNNGVGVPCRIGTAGGITSMTIGQDLVIVSSETTPGATAFIGFTSGGLSGAINLHIGGSTVINSKRSQDAGIESSGMLTMVTGGSLSVATDTFPAQTGRAYIQGNNTMSVMANDITLTGFPGGGAAFIQGFDGSVTVLSNVSTHLFENSFMRNMGPGKLVVVVDQQAPLPPQIGNGSFDLEMDAFLTTNGGDLSIFTALPAQNNVSGLINGATLSGGTQVFGVYYLLSGVDPPPFTIFYKFGSSNSGFFNSITTAISEMIQDDFGRAMGWVWMGPFWICNATPHNLQERFIFYRKPFEYPLYVNEPLQCDGEEGHVIQEEWLPIRYQ